MKNLAKIVVVFFLFLFTAVPIQAQNVAGVSAKFMKLEAKNLDKQRFAKKRLAINKILLKYKSPLSDSIDAFLSTCETYELDCYLLPSIAGLESSFGKFTYPGSHNPFGWGGGYIMFENWDQAISSVGKGLRENYHNKGAYSVDEIAPIYAESKTWAPRVKSFMAAFESEEAKIDSIFEQNTVKL